MEKEELNQHIARLLACAEDLNKKEYIVVVEFYYNQFQTINVHTRVSAKGHFGGLEEVLYYDSLTDTKGIDNLPKTILQMERLRKEESK